MQLFRIFVAPNEYFDVLYLRQSSRSEQTRKEDFHTAPIAQTLLGNRTDDVVKKEKPTR